MSIRIDTKSRKAIIRLGKIKGLTQSGVEFATWVTAKGLKSSVSNEILKRPKGGRVYIRRTAAGRRRRHVASKAGETHANFSGTLRRSLDFKVRPTELEFGYGVQKNDAPDYAEWVEFGTVRMKARPSLQIGIRKSTRDFQVNLKNQIGKRLEGKGGFLK